MDIIEFLGWIAFFYLMWQLVSAWVVVQGIRHAVRNAVSSQLEIEQQNNSTATVKFDYINQGPYSLILVYDHNTNQFLGQANSESEAQCMLQTRYPSKNFVVNKTITVNSTDNSIDTKSN